MTLTPIGRWILVTACVFVGTSMVAPDAATWVAAVLIVLGILAWLGAIALAPIVWGLRGLTGRKMLSGQPVTAPAAPPAAAAPTPPQGLTLPPLWPLEREPPVSP